MKEAHREQQSSPCFDVSKCVTSPCVYVCIFFSLLSSDNFIKNYVHSLRRRQMRGFLEPEDQGLLDAGSRLCCLPVAVAHPRGRERGKGDWVFLEGT